MVWRRPTLGLCMHVRPMYLIYAPFACFLAYQRSGHGRVRFLSILWFTVGCFLIVLPWSIYISAREGSIILLSSNGGETLAGGFNPELLRIGRDAPVTFVTPEGRSTWVGPGKWLPPEATGYLGPHDEGLTYTQQAGLLQKRAIAWMWAHPTDSLYLACRKLLYLWGIYPFWNGLSQTLFGNVPVLILIILSTFALYQFRSSRMDLSLFWTLPIFVSCVAIISWGSWRFREPGDLGLIAIASLLARPKTKQVQSETLRLGCSWRGKRKLRINLYTAKQQLEAPAAAGLSAIQWYPRSGVGSALHAFGLGFLLPSDLRL